MCFNFCFSIQLPPINHKKMYPEIFGMKIYIPFEFLTVKKIFKGEGG